MSTEQIARKGIVVGRLLESVREYFGLFGKPIPMQALSAKYCRALSNLGGFPEVIEELRMDGTLDVVLRTSGGKVVYPGGEVIRVHENERLVGR